MIYKLRMLSDEDDFFLREYEIPAANTLVQLHEYISQELGFEPDGVVSFFASNEQWEKLAEFTLVDMGEGGSVPMDGVRLESIIETPHARLIYLFDVFNDRALYIESAEAAEQEAGAEYPRTILSHGDAPDQYKAGAEVGETSIFDDAMGDFDEFEGNDYYDDGF